MNTNPQRPNILLITSDQHHYSALGCVNPRIRTPHLDRLAREGTYFSRAYCPNPTCTPTRASIITGQYPSWHGAWTLGTHLAEDVPTLGDAFQRHGYRTGLVGKAHFQALANMPQYPSLEAHPTLRDLEFWRQFHGPWYGFQHVETARMHADEAHVGGHYALWLEEKGLHNWRDYFQEYPPRPDTPNRFHTWDLPEEMHYNHWTAERSNAFMEQAHAGGTPFLLWASFHDPHPPYLVPEPWATMYDPDDMEPGTLTPGELQHMPPHFAMTQQERPDFSAYRESGFGIHGMQSHLRDPDMAKRDMAVYYGMTSFMDQQIGRILDKLDELELAKNTVVVFTSDHGHFLGQHGLWHKGPFHYEDEIRVPFLVRWPGHVPPATQTDALQSLVDLAPTFLNAAGSDIPGMMQGVSQLEVWEGARESARDELMVEFRHEPTTIHLRTMVTDRYKITVYRDRSYGELFDLQEDPEERRNLWADPAHADCKAALFQQWVNAELKREPMRMPRIAHA